MQAAKTKTKVKTYEAYVLGLVLIVGLLAEYAVVSNATAADWKAGLSVLDISASVTQTVSDIKFVFEPAVSTVSSVYNFYQTAATVATPMFDFTNDQGVSPMQFVYGVNLFYQDAAQQMASVLDLSNYVPGWQPQVAAASISR